MKECRFCMSPKIIAIFVVCIIKIRFSMFILHFLSQYPFKQKINVLITTWLTISKKCNIISSSYCITIIVTKKNDEGYGAKFSSRLTFPIKQENLITAYQKKKDILHQKKNKTYFKVFVLENFSRLVLFFIF